MLFSLGAYGPILLTFLLYQVAKQLVKSIYHGTIIVGCDHPALEFSRALLEVMPIWIAPL